MNTPGEFAGRSIAVIGLAATGLATARILLDQGARVTLYESKPEAGVDVGRLAEARELVGISLVFDSREPDWSHTDLVVPSPGVPRYAPSLMGAVERGVPVLSEIEVAYRLAQAPILAITGTNGKTTTTALLGAICREAGLPTAVAGNIAEDAGARLPLIQAAVSQPSEGVIVAEVSSFQLEWVERFRPVAAAWLNLSEDHLDRHRDINEYALAKAGIFRAQTEADVAVVNADDPLVYRFSQPVGKGRRWQFSLEGRPEGERVAYLSGAGSLILDSGEGEQTLMEAAQVPLPGRHNLANVLAAAAMAAAREIPLEAVRTAVQGFRGVAHRMEQVASIAGVRYLNNSMCTNPAAVEASAAAVESPLVAIAGGIHKGGDLGPMARALARYARQVVLIGRSAPEIQEALRREGMEAVEVAATLPEAVQRAAALAVPGDTVMLVPGCASFDMFTGFEQRGQVFREAVRALEEGEE